MPELHSRSSESNTPPAETRGYVTSLSTDSYLNGALILDESLRMVGSMHLLHVLVGANVGPEARRTLSRAGVRTIAAPAIEVPDEIIEANLASDYHPHWAGVFEKLLVFSLCEFDKVVFLDSDMLVLKNIDHLFDVPHMSGVVADRVPGNEDCVDLNAGLMVIEPAVGLSDRLFATLRETFSEEVAWRAAVGRPPSMGVQSVINRFWPEWKTSSDLQLDLKYNVLADHLDYFNQVAGLGWRGRDGIHVLHFVGMTKPWSGSMIAASARISRSLAKRRFRRAAAYLACLTVLGRARLRLAVGHGFGR